MTEDQTVHRIPLDRLVRSVVFNQILFTAGLSLTTGGFLSFYALDLKAQANTITWILVLPELVGLTAIGTPLLLKLGGNKKTLFIATSLLARLFALLIPGAAFIREGGVIPLLITGIIVSGILQAIAFTALLSWLSDLAPEQKWGRVFSRRNMAHAALLIVLPLLTAYLRDTLNTRFSLSAHILTGYLVIFSIGILLQLISLLPLLPWPASAELGSPLEAHLREEYQIAAPAVWPVSPRSYVLVLLFNFWLAFFQGHTQSAFFLYGSLHLNWGLSHYYELAGCMYFLQVLTAWGAGWWSDRFGNRNLLALSTWVTGCGLFFWLASLGGDGRWLWGAYILWGAFGAVNLTLQNLMLKVVPREKNTSLIALHRFGSGFIAGLSGILGGYWLNLQPTLNRESIVFDDQVLYSLGLLFTVSLIGRLLAPLWLVGVQEPEPAGGINEKITSPASRY